MSTATGILNHSDRSIQPRQTGRYAEECHRFERALARAECAYPVCEDHKFYFSNPASVVRCVPA